MTDSDEDEPTASTDDDEPTASTDDDEPTAAADEDEPTAAADEGTDPDADRSERTDQKPVVVVVAAETPGNVGTIARAMKNFGLSELLLVDPPDLDPGGEAYGFAGHAREDVLPNAREVTFDEVVDSYHTVGFTAITGEDSRRHVRFPPTTPAGLADDLRDAPGRTALVFGREGKGLSNEELERLDRVASIPASAEYPVLNLGQAATVTFYALRDLTLQDTQLPDADDHRADPADVERLHDYWDRFLTAMGQRDHKHGKTRRLFRRLVGRADPTDREVNTLLGVLRRASDQLEQRRELLDELDREDDLRE